MLLPATLAGAYYRAPVWLLIVLCVFSGVSVLLYLGSFVYLLGTDRDALRSERYSLQKLAIEKGLYGDSTSGVVELLDDSSAKLLSSRSSNAEGVRS
jgi:hypothetical protein